MIRSMTGFGRGEAESRAWKVRAELKTVNHRFLDLSLRISRGFTSLEEPIRARLQEAFSRGRIEVSVHVDPKDTSVRQVHLDKGLLQGYLRAVEEIKDTVGAESSPAVNDYLQLPHLIEVGEPDVDWDELENAAARAVREAAAQVQAMRQREGQRLAADLVSKSEQVLQLVDAMEQRSPQVVVNYQQRLLARLKELLNGVDAPEDRIAAEVAVFADRSSIDEEIVRLRSHIQQLHQSMDEDASVGRKLDFLLQEMNREANTIASKANDGELSRSVVNLKAELEKMREQVQNIE